MACHVELCKIYYPSLNAKQSWACRNELEVVALSTTLDTNKMAADIGDLHASTSI